MAETGLVQIIEGALLAAGKPLTVPQLADLFDEQEERPANTDIREALVQVAERCEDRGFELQEVASGFRFQVRQSLSPWVARLWQERPQKYSRALLETLSLIAYRQPITRGEIEEIRGVAVSSNIIKTLHEREWVRVVGHRDVPGRPAMFATTRQFLDYFNLKTLDQLPALAEIRDLETLNVELGFADPESPAADGSPADGSPTDGSPTDGSPNTIDSEDSPALAIVGGTEFVASAADVNENEAVDDDSDSDTTAQAVVEEEPPVVDEESDQASEVAAVEVTAETETSVDTDTDTTAAAPEQSDADTDALHDNVDSALAEPDSRI